AGGRVALVRAGGGVTRVRPGRGVARVRSRRGAAGGAAGLGGGVGSGSRRVGGRPRRSRLGLLREPPALLLLALLALLRLPGLPLGTPLGLLLGLAALLLLALLALLGQFGAVVLDAFLEAAEELVELASPVLLLGARSEEHTSELQSRENLVCRLLLEK